MRLLPWQGAYNALARAANGSDPKQPLSVRAENLHFVLIAERNGVYPLHRRLVGHERPVDRKQNPVDAELHHAAQERGIGKVAAGRDVEMLAEHVAEAALPCRSGARARDRCARSRS